MLLASLLRSSQFRARPAIPVCAKPRLDWTLEHGTARTLSPIIKAHDEDVRPAHRDQRRLETYEIGPAGAAAHRGRVASK